MQFLDVIVCQTREQGEISRVTPEADLAHLHEQDLFCLLVDTVVLVVPHLCNEVLVSVGQLDDSWPRGAECLDLEARKDIVVLPVLGQAE